MKCPNTESWELLAIDALEGDEAEALRAHAGACESCRGALLAARRAHVERVRAYEAFDHDHDRLREELLANLPAGPPQARRGAGGLRRLGEFVMRLNTSATRRAAALLLPAACVAIGVMFLVTPAQQSAFAAAVERLREARTITCRFETYMNESESPMQTGVMYMSDERGMRFDASMPSVPGLTAGGDATMTMVHLKDGPVLVIQPMLKLALRMHVPNGPQTLSGPLNQTAPDAFLQSFRKLTGEADARLGRSTIEGVEAEGFEVHAEKLALAPVGGTLSEETEPARARLWVDARSHLPVQMVIEASQPTGFVGGAMRVKVVMSRFEFDRPLDDAMFNVAIPDGYKVIEATIPAPSEESLVAGLRIFSEVTGRYPAVLDAGQMSAEVAVTLASSGSLPADASDPASALSGEFLEKMMTVAIGSTYAQQLVREGRAVEWFGDAVSPGEAGEVLIRWTLPEGGKRVIYGDLRVETVR